MRVLSIIHYPTFGGPHNRNAHIVPHLAADGIDLTVLLPADAENAAARLRDRAVEVIQIPLGRLRGGRDVRARVAPLIRFRGDVGRLRAVIKRGEFDIVLINGLINPHGAVAASLENRPVVWQLLDTFPPVTLRAAMMPLVLSMANALMTSGIAVADAHPGAMRFGERLFSFFPGVDLDRFTASTEMRQGARAELGFADSDEVVGNVSNLNPMKGHMIFVEAAAELRRRRPGVRFAILGATYPQHADYARNVREFAAARGLEVGKDLVIRDPEDDVAGLASAFDVFWLTSEPRSEGLSTVAGEAMALGVPVVAARVGALAESVLDGETGYLVEPRDAAAFAQRTEELFEDSDLRVALGAAARHRAEACYDPSAGAAQHSRAFHAALLHHGREQ